ncbi:MAG TPA: DMT family transporter [Candidatus Acidoferrales bacterium]|nr:DMT family transporter [Candidatus Acidoferrales bacterium]
MKFSVKQKAIAAVCIVALSYVLLNVATRFMNAGFGPFTQVYLRIGLGLMLTALFFMKEIHPAKFLKTGTRDWLLLLLMGTAGYGLAVDFITLGILHTKLLNVSVITATTPLFVFLFTIFMLRKKIRYSLLFYLILSFYGVYVIATKSFLAAISNFGIGDLYVLFFAMGLGAYILGRKFLSKHLNNSEITLIVLVIAFVCSLITALIFGEQLSASGFFNSAALFGLILAGMLILVATKLQNFGFDKLDSVVGSQIMLLQIVVAPVLGFVLYKETILPVEFAGAALVVIGVWAYIRQAKD